MRVGIDIGRDHVEFEAPDSRVIGVRRQPPSSPLEDLAAAVRQALATPFNFPPLRNALTPDDQIAIVLDDSMPCLPEALPPILELLAQSQVKNSGITIVCPTTECQHRWRDALPVEWNAVRFEVHDLADRKKQSYLATTSKGRRVYLNRTVVDADQTIILTRRGYDPLLGYSGAEGAIFPVLSDEAILLEASGRLSLEDPDTMDWPLKIEATEVAWLLGAPFFLQIIEGAGDQIEQIVGGTVDAVAEGERLLNARWRCETEDRADTVIATLGGDPDRHDFADLARALTCASRVVKPDGRIALLSRATPKLGTGAAILAGAIDPERALKILRKHPRPELIPAYQWASAAQRASLFVLCGLPDESVESLFATPLQDVREAQRLLDAEGTCLFLPDAHKMLAVCPET